MPSLSPTKGRHLPPHWKFSSGRNKCYGCSTKFRPSPSSLFADCVISSTLQSSQEPFVPHGKIADGTTLVLDHVAHLFAGGCRRSLFLRTTSSRIPLVNLSAQRLPRAFWGRRCSLSVMYSSVYRPAMPTSVHDAMLS